MADVELLVERARDADHCLCFFFQAEDGIRDVAVTGVQTCALPISSGSRALMAATTGVMRLISRSCLEPINRAITLSITWSTCMGPFRDQFEIQSGQPGEDGEPLLAPHVTDGANPHHFDVWPGANDSFYPVRRTVRKAGETMRGGRVLQPIRREASGAQWEGETGAASSPAFPEAVNVPKVCPRKWRNL